MAEFPIAEVNALGWRFRATIPSSSRLDRAEIIIWCRDQFGESGAGKRWDFYISTHAGSFVILLQDPNDAFLLKMRWA